MIIARLLKSKFNANKLRSYPLDQMMVDNLKKVIEMYNPNVKQRLVVSILKDETKAKFGHTAPDAFLEIVEDQSQV